MVEKAKYTVLIVDDDDEFRTSLSKTFAKEGYQVSAAADGLEALGRIREDRFDLAIVDLKMPGLGGIELLTGIKKASPDTEVIIVTAYGETATKLAAMRAGAFGYLDKPVKRKEILRYAERALSKRPVKTYPA